jgi:hypothetical protein
VTAARNTFIRVDITLKSKDTGGTSPIRLYNRAIPGLGLTFPILKSLGGFGARMGEVIPQPFSGEVVIDNTLGSLETERRFIDLLERFAINEQPISIYVALVAEDVVDPTADWELVFTGRVTSWSTRGNGEELVLSTSTNTFERRTLGRRVDRNESIFSDAPQESAGAYLPVVIGRDRQVKAYRITTATSLLDTKSEAKFAYAVTLGTTFVHGGVSKYIAKDYLGEQVEVISVSNEDSHFLSTSTGATLNFATNSLTEICQLITFSAPIRVMSGVDIRVVGTNNGSWAGNEGIWGVRIYGDGGSNKNFGPLIAEATRSKQEDEGLFQSNTSDWVPFQFDKPVVVSGDLWLSVFQTYDSPTGDEGDAIQISLDTAPGSATVKELRKKLSRDNYRFRFGSNYLSYRLFGVKFTDTITPPSEYINSDGIGVSYFTAKLRAATGDEVYADTIFNTAGVLNSLDLIVEMAAGLVDTPGTITGAPLQFLDRPHWAIQVLTHTWNGSAWVPGPIDTTQYSARNATIFGASNTYRRRVNGVFNNEVTVEAAVAEICRNSATRIVFFNGASKQLAVWAWGEQTAAVATITESDTIGFEIEQRNSEANVTRLNIDYDKVLFDLKVQRILVDRGSDIYLGTLKFDPNNSSLAAALSTKEAIYGKNPARRTDFPFISDVLSATNVGTYYLETLSEPAIYVTLEVPYYKFKDVNLMEVVNIHHSHMPAFFGSAPELRGSHYNYEQVDPVPGYATHRAQMYSAQVESKRLNFNPRGPVTITFEARLLKSPRVDLN